IATGAAESSFVSFPGGLNATAVSQVNLFGAVRTAGNAINLSSLVLNNGGGYPYALGFLDTTNDGSAPAGAPITIESLNVSGGAFGFETGANNVLTLTGASDLNGLLVTSSGSIEATGDVILGGGIEILGDQNYAANVTLGSDTNITGNTATFANALEGAGNDLRIGFTQTSTVDGFNNVHNFTALSAVELNGSFSTTGAQNYAGPVTLVGDTTLVDQPSTRFTLDYGNMSVAGNLSGIGQARAIATSSDGQYAFIAADSSGLQVVNIADPANQTVVGNASTADVARDVVLSADGQYAYVAVFLQGVEVYDISNVSAPTLVGSEDTEKAVGLSLSTDGQHLFVADGNAGGLQVLNVSDPTNPAIVGTSVTSGFAVDVAVSADGQRAYVADQAGGLVVMDVSNVAAPTPVCFRRRRR
ncbi:MAG: hypothetical protein EBZ13_05700, partial [Planctomycetia bacterium]|nr:hypothetical protein [Planctomycetia bacterium]